MTKVKDVVGLETQDMPKDSEEMILLPESGMPEIIDEDMPIDLSLPETGEALELEETEKELEDKEELEEIDNLLGSNEVMDKFGEALPIETKAILEKDIPIGEETFELFKDFDMHGGEFYYLVLPSGGKMLGFLANFQGDLIDLKGDVITSLVQLNSMLMDQDFNEYEDGATGILVR